MILAGVGGRWYVDEVVRWRTMSKKISITTKKKCAEMLAASADTQREIAQVLDISERTISRWKDEPKFAELIKKFQDRETLDRLRRYKAGANKAFQKLLDLLECGEPKVELAAAKEIIRLAGDETEVLNLKDSNNIFDVIERSTREAVDISDIREIEPETEFSDDVVESPGV